MRNKKSLGEILLEQELINEEKLDQGLKDSVLSDCPQGSSYIVFSYFFRNLPSF